MRISGILRDRRKLTDNIKKYGKQHTEIYITANHEWVEVDGGIATWNHRLRAAARGDCRLCRIPKTGDAFDAHE